jgi:small ligand-binding sensory domain FIST
MTAPVFAGALSTDLSSARAEQEAVARLREGLGGHRPDLLLVFATHHHGSALEQLGPRLAEATGARVVAGCTGESIVGGTREVEQHSALSLWAASLPETRVSAFRSRATEGPDGEPRFDPLPTLADPERSTLLVFGEPYSFPMDAWLGELNRALPGVPAIGGLASGGMGPGQNLLISAEGLHEDGLLGVVLEGAIEVRTVVSQGCRPVGKPWVITSCKQNVIEKLAGRPALEVLMQALQHMHAADQEIFRRAPFVGLAIDASKQVFERGDFLVRGVIGLLEQERAFAVADIVRRGQTVQFLVRDAQSAGEDLRLLLRQSGGGSLARSSANSAGALLFSCNGRGSRMFAQPDHDVSCVLEGLEQQLPIAGFFAAGEVGPVGRRNFLHGFTASIAIFRERAPTSDAG